MREIPTERQVTVDAEDLALVLRALSSRLLMTDPAYRHLSGTIDRLGDAAVIVRQRATLAREQAEREKVHPEWKEPNGFIDQMQAERLRRDPSDDAPLADAFHERTGRCVSTFGNQHIGCAILEGKHRANVHDECIPSDGEEPSGPRCRYCGADCSQGRSWDGGDQQITPADWHLWVTCPRCVSKSPWPIPDLPEEQPEAPQNGEVVVASGWRLVVEPSSEHFADGSIGVSLRMEPIE